MRERFLIFAMGLGIVASTPAHADTLISVNFYAHLSGGLDTPKTGLAAAGHSANDFWNHYSRDAAPGQWLSFGGISNLKTAEGVATSCGLTIANAPGAWGNGSSDAMYNTYLYPLGGGNITVTVTNLASGNYDFYVYGSDASYQLVVDGVDYGAKATANAPISNPVVWQENVQYVVMRNVALAGGQNATVTVSPGVGG